MGLHVVVVDEAEHVNAFGGVDVDISAAVDGLSADDAAVDVDHLDNGITFVANDPIVIVKESEVIVVVCVPANEHQLEAAGVVRRVGLEGVARVGEEVNVVSGQIINKVEIVEADFLSSEAEGVVAVLFSLEAEGQLALVLGVDDGVWAAGGLHRNARWRGRWWRHVCW